jgi:hypothetical protein
MDGTGSASCLMSGFDVRGIEFSDSVTILFVIATCTIIIISVLFLPPGE